MPSRLLFHSRTFRARARTILVESRLDFVGVTLYKVLGVLRNSVLAVESSKRTSTGPSCTRSTALANENEVSAPGTSGKLAYLDKLDRHILDL